MKDLLDLTPDQVKELNDRLKKNKKSPKLFAKKVPGTDAKWAIYQDGDYMNQVTALSAHQAIQVWKDGR